MRGAVFHGRGDVRVESVPEPAAPPPGHLLLDVQACALCGTDASEYAHGPLMIPLDVTHQGSGHRGPLIIGHEFAGQIRALGDGVTGFDIGEHVVPGAGVWCGMCRWCLEGRVNICARYHVLGLHADGGMADASVVPAAMCHRVPDGMNAVVAAMAQPVAVALHAVRRSGAGPHRRVALIGIGGIGSLTLVALRSAGVTDVVAIDVDAGRLAGASALGATQLVQISVDQPAQDVVAQVGEAPDIVIEASGRPAGIRLATTLVRRGGRIHLVGIPSAPVEMPIRDLVVAEVDITTSNGHVCDVDLPEAIAVLALDEVARAIPQRVIPLEVLVEGGLRPLSQGHLQEKVIVRMT